MAISEVNSLVDLLERTTQLVFTVINNYKQTSTEIQAFTAHVTEYRRDIKEWQQLLRKYPLRLDHPVITGLEEAVRKLDEQKQAVHAMDVSNCCLRFWKKALAPDDLIASLRDVDKEFQDVLASLRKEEDLKEKERLLQAAVEKAPFSFSDDRKYVPVMKTVQKVRKALEGDGSSNVRKVVLVHGASGEGKSTLAKFLAWDYFKKSKGASSFSDFCRFSDGVVFISCKEMTKSDSLFLLQKLGADLGYSLEASPVREVRSDGRDAATLRQIDLDDFKRKLIPLLSKKSILIILDDVSDPDVIQDLMMPPEGSDVNYLITSQRGNIWSSDKIVPIGTPSTEEARTILANHIVGWNGKPFPPHVRGEVDTLIEQVQNHPLVIANLASRIKGDNVSKLGTWVQLRKQLKNALEAAAEDQSVPNVTMLFNTTFKHSAIASLTMAFKDISDEARSLLLLLALCTGQGVPENVLTLWFKALHGANMFSFQNAIKDLQARSLIMITDTEVEWSLCSIHDLRRQLAPEMYKDAAEDILEKLIEGVPERSMGGREGLVSRDGSDEYLMAVLFFLYSDEKYRQDVREKLNFYDPYSVENRISCVIPYQIALGEKFMKIPYQIALGEKFMKMIGQLLHPSLEKASEWETVHELAKSVILRFIRSGELEDHTLSNLLEVPSSKTFSTTCSALATCPLILISGRSPVKFPMSIRRFLEPLRKWVDEPPVVDNIPNLLTCLRAFLFFTCTEGDSIFAVVEDLPIFLTKLLLWSSSNSLANVACTLLSYLDLLCSSKNYRVQLAAAPGMLETLLGLLNSNSDLGQSFLKQASKTFLRLACSDPDIKVKTILLPDVLNILVRVLPLVPKWTLESLRKLSWTPENADSIASHPGALDEILQLVTCTKDCKAKKKAVLYMGQLASFPSTRTIIASKCLSAFRTLIQLLTQDASPKLMEVIFIAVREVISEFESETLENILVDFLEKLDLLIREDVDATVRNCAADALFNLASKQPIRKRLEAHPGLLEQIFRFPTFADTAVTVTFMEFANNIVSEIFIERKDMGETRRTTLAAAVVKMYTALIQDNNTESEVQRMAAKGLATIFRMYEYCSVAVETGAEQSILIHMKKDPTFYMSVEGAHIVKDILLERALLTKVIRPAFVTVGLKFYVTNLRATDKVQLPEYIVRAIASFAYLKQIRELLTDVDTLELLLGHVTKSAAPLVLTCVAQIIYRVCCTEYDEAQRTTLLAGTLKRYVVLLCQGIPMELREAAMESLLIFVPQEETQHFLSTNESVLDLLLGLVREDTSAQTLHRIAYLLQNILVKGPGQEEVQRMAFMDRAVERFVQLLADGISIRVQAGALGGLGRLTFMQESGEIRVAYPGALVQLTRFLRKVDFRDMLEEVYEMIELFSACQMDAEVLQEDMSGLRSYALQCFMSVMEDGEAEGNMQNHATWCLARILRYETNRKLFSSVFASSNESLSGLVHRASQLSLSLMEAYTLIDPLKAGAKSLSSVMALEGRCLARISLKQYKSALEDCDNALKLVLREPSRELERLLVLRGYIKAEVGDVEGALEDLNRAVESVNLRIKWTNRGESPKKSDLYNMSSYLQERGILKSRMLDYRGAMLDLNESLRIDTEPDNYEVLKNRGYAKFCLGDEDGARFDAEQANSERFRRYMFPSLGFFRSRCLGVLPVKYLEFAL